MTSTATLLPTTVALSSDSAIESILTDIPLFCEGIMGIGVFTFLFITKQVTCLSLFLYGSSFLAFAAATFDLGQVLARETHNDTATGIGLNTIAGVIFSREIFLSLSVLLLDLFFWTLVARCPRGECTERSNELSTDRRRRLPSMHSASWNRWGLIGTILKWGSLAALLSVPLLQMLWRLLPGQRKYAAIYVAESTIQTSITAIFILKFFLNVYISPLDYWWHAFRIYIVPITSLIIGVALGIGNLIVFSFTETSLGRLLRAVEVYLLIVHNLYTTFQYVSSPLQRPGQESNLPSQKTQPEKSPYTNTLPFAYASGYPQFATVAPMIVPQRSEGSLRASTMTWGLPPRRTPSPSQSHIQELDVETAPTSNEVTRNVSRSEPRQHKDSLVGVGVSSGQPRASEGTRVEQEPPGSERPYTAVSLSYYTMDPNSPQTMKQDLPRSSKPKTIPLDYSNGKNERMEGSTRYQPFKLTPPSIGSQQASITSIDELLRQQTELDKSIAALRLVSMSMQTDISSPSKIKNPEPTSRTASTAPDQSRSTLVSSKTESFSNRSDFSLSVFPNPPIIPRDEVATKYTVEEVRKGENQVAVVQNSEKKDLEPLTIIPLSNAALQSPAQVHLDSAPTQYDVTSFIGDLTRPSSNPQIDMSQEDFGSDAEEVPIIAAATVSPASGLRPMILASMVLTSPAEPNTTTALAATTYDDERAGSNFAAEPTLSLRPLLLGKPPSSQSISQQFPVTMVPLAQRRQRGGTISSNTRRPVISAPRLNEDGTEGAPGAFERPRPPPLRLNEQRSAV